MFTVFVNILGYSRVMKKGQPDGHTCLQHPQKPAAVGGWELTHSVCLLQHQTYKHAATYSTQRCSSDAVEHYLAESVIIFSSFSCQTGPSPSAMPHGKVLLIEANVTTESVQCSTASSWRLSGKQVLPHYTLAFFSLKSKAAGRGRESGGRAMTESVCVCAAG